MEPPRSSGTESVETFRNTLSKLLKTAPSQEPPDDAANRVVAALVAAGEAGLTVAEAAARADTDTDTVVAALNLPADTAPTTRIRIAAEARTKSTRRR